MVTKPRRQSVVLRGQPNYLHFRSVSGPFHSRLSFFQATFTNKGNIARVAAVADARAGENIRVRREGGCDRAESLRRRASGGLIQS